MKFDELITPCYIINNDEYQENITKLMEAFASRWPGKVLFGYSVKTNHLPYMLKGAKEHGWYAEVVSPDEYDLAIRCGCEDNRIIYNGPQKRDTVLEAIRKKAIVNLDNLQEVEYVISKLSESEKKEACVGIRINYDLEKDCPSQTTCKNTVGRFGICYENGDVLRAVELLNNSGIGVSGLHMHASSTTRSLDIFSSIANKAVDIIEEYNLKKLQYIDIGGGFFGGNFFPGKPGIDEYATCICDILKKRCANAMNITLILEPGAAILATSMDYMCSVLNIREIRGERVVTLDGTSLHINPMMNPHETPFTIVNPGEETWQEQIFGGSTCMEMDRFLPRGIHNLVEADTKLLFHACGAYMSTHNSNFINAAPNIYVKEKEEYTVLRLKKNEIMMEY